MHDPKVVAWELVLPAPIRSKWRDAKPGQYQWGIRRHRRTNPENLGEPVWPWWRLRGYDSFRLAGRAFRWMRFGTIWHNEPGGKDALTVCRQRIIDRKGFWAYTGHWKWHVHHWSLQIFLLQRLRRFVLDRCKMCGRRFPYGYAPVGYSWDPPRRHFWQAHTDTYHHECSALGQLRQTVEKDTQLVRALVGLLQVAGQDEADVLGWLTDHKGPIGEFNLSYRLQNILGYERDDEYNLVKKAER